MLDAGASGYILKNTGRIELELAQEKVADGEFCFHQSVGKVLAQDILVSRLKKESKKENRLKIEFKLT
ncbi:MAG: hypothetical protein ACLFQ0_19305 [Cyclobacteriaceae bacterium]